MKSLFDYICKNYSEYQTEIFSNHMLGKKLRHDLPNKIFELLNLDNSQFKVTGVGIK